MSRRTAFLAAIITFSSLCMPIAANAQQHRIDGVGAAKCSAIVAGYASQPTATVNDMMGWAYGYMTRRNIERVNAGLRAVNLQPDGFGPAEMVTLMMNFCQENPEIRYYRAVDALFEIMAKDQGLIS